MKKFKLFITLGLIVLLSSNALEAAKRRKTAGEEVTGSSLNESFSKLSVSKRKEPVTGESRAGAKRQKKRKKVKKKVEIGTGKKLFNYSFYEAYQSVDDKNQVLALLRDETGSINEAIVVEALYDAVLYRHTDIILFLLSNPNTRGLITGYNLGMALKRAAERGDLDSVKFLLIDQRIRALRPKLCLEAVSETLRVAAAHDQRGIVDFLLTEKNTRDLFYREDICESFEAALAGGQDEKTVSSLLIAKFLHPLCCVVTGKIIKGRVIDTLSKAFFNRHKAIVLFLLSSQKTQDLISHDEIKEAYERDRVSQGSLSQDLNVDFYALVEQEIIRRNVPVSVSSQIPVF